MTSLNISLPEPLKAYVEDRVASGDFGTPTEFIRSLIRQDKEQRRMRIEAELLDALNSRQRTLSPEELKDRTVVDVLREKLAARGSACASRKPRRSRLSSRQTTIAAFPTSGFRADAYKWTSLAICKAA